MPSGRAAFTRAFRLDRLCQGREFSAGRLNFRHNLSVEDLCDDGSVSYLMSSDFYPKLDRTSHLMSALVGFLCDGTAALRDAQGQFCCKQVSGCDELLDLCRATEPAVNDSIRGWKGVSGSGYDELDMIGSDRMG